MLKTSGVVCGTLHSAYLRILQVSPSSELQLQFLGKRMKWGYTLTVLPSQRPNTTTEIKNLSEKLNGRESSKDFTKMFL